MGELILSTAVINERNFKEELFTLIEIVDADFTGSNGSEYVSDFALENGFKSDLDYSINKAINDKKSLEDIIKSVINDLKKHSLDGFYVDNVVNITKINEGFVVSIAVC